MVMLASLLITLLLTSTSGANQASIDIPYLAGDYSTSAQPLNDVFSTRQAFMTIPPEVLHIDHMRLVISGVWAEGFVSCVNSPGYIYIPDLTLSLAAPDRPSAPVFRARIAPPNGPFQNLTAIIEADAPPGSSDPDCLLGTEIRATLSCIQVFIADCGISSDSYGTLTDVHMEIGGTLPVEPATWGAIKTLYN